MPNKFYDTNQSLAQAMGRTQWSGNSRLTIAREGNAAQDKRVAATIDARKQEHALDREFQRQIEAAKPVVKMAGTQKGNEPAQEIEQLNQLGCYNFTLP